MRTEVNEGDALLTQPLIALTIPAPLPPKKNVHGEMSKISINRLAGTELCFQRLSFDPFIDRPPGL